MDKSMFRIITVFFLVLLNLTACTSKEMYQAVQQNREHNCRTKPPQEREQCEENLNKKTYEEYEEAVKSVQKKK